MTAAETAEFNKAAICYFAVFAALVGMFSWVERVERKRLEDRLELQSTRE